MKNKVMISIRIKFFLAFFFALFAGTITFLLLNGFFRKGNMDFSKQIDHFSAKALGVMEEIEQNHTNQQKLKAIINENIVHFYIYITDEKGNVLLQPEHQSIEKIDIGSIRLQQEVNLGKTFYSENGIICSKLKKIGTDRYAIISKLLVKGDTHSLILIGVAVFILVFFLLTYERMDYIKKLCDALKAIALGNLDTSVEVKGKDELALLARSINDMTKELKNKTEEKERAEKTKNELIINMSHDLRTPLTSIIGYIKLMEEKNTEEKLRHYIHIIDDKAQRLEKMIGDLFEYTLLTNDQIQLTLADVSINELTRQVVEEMLPLAQENDITMTYHALKEDLTIRADALKIVRVYENVISNAVKYGQKSGTVEIRLSHDEQYVLISIFNKGSWIGKEDEDKIFERFYRTDKARNSEMSGSGIGLSIAKSIVELHQGKIWAEKTEDGTYFHIKLLKEL